MSIYQLVVFICIFLLTSTLSYVSMQRLNFENLFKANSTSQIKTLLLLFSFAIGFVISLGVNEILELIKNISSR